MMTSSMLDRVCRATEARRLNARHLKKYFGVLLFFIASIILLQAGGIL